MTMQDDRAHARTTDPTTSHAAADSVENLTETRRRILTLLTIYGPLTDEGIREQYHRIYGRGPSDSGLRTRRRELCNRALVRDSGDRSRTAAGRATIVWEAVAQA